MCCDSPGRRCLRGESEHKAQVVFLTASYTVRYFCRLESGSMKVDATSITFGAATSTQAIPCSSAASEAGSREAAILSGTVTWSLSNGQLTLTHQGIGTLVLTPAH